MISLREKYSLPRENHKVESTMEEMYDDYESIPFHPLYKAMSFYDTTNVTIEEEEVDTVDHTQLIQSQIKEIWETVQLKAVWKPMVTEIQINIQIILYRHLCTYTTCSRFQTLPGSPISS